MHRYMWMCGIAECERVVVAVRVVYLLLLLRACCCFLLRISLLSPPVVIEMDPGATAGRGRSRSPYRLHGTGEVLIEGQNWKASQWCRINTGGELERVMVPLNTPVWAEHKGKEYRHPGSGHPSNWDDKFDVKTDEEQLEHVRESIQALKKKKAQIKERIIEKEAKAAKPRHK